ncbi:hypothetical protein AAF712_004147 [Marasmius tenuissimus]|uniref:Uncharacterized protein n=1 Tax=Marasmius tenuissimus TaxID=585030 RepID=A0ABR3A8F8_9AGAR
MTDNDVQDVRDMVAKQRAELALNKDMAEKMKKLADTPEVQSEDYLLIEQLKQAKQAEREKRLGIQSFQEQQSVNGQRVCTIKASWYMNIHAL